MIIRWTGLGVLLYLFSCLAIPAAFWAKETTYRLTGTHNVQLAELAVALVMLVFAAAVWFVGSLLNAKGDRHTVMGTPLQNGAALFLLVAWLMPCIAVGQTTHPVWGWLMFPSAILLWFLWLFISGLWTQRHIFYEGRAKLKAERENPNPPA
ncbi:hypothetical protein GCM10010168_69890 [Actinoplanes ianthinogenes]|uniref:Transmembrane protein n=1 Tax=Actinoplanes ianthinogenes TaxID=122358 RepID=A0ABM7M0U0_9ACTN|nr:hypothetical protein [Actinoplanes ianthinogenes]BCJ45188.1 hypothetical protein Aiant_58450 [Actinoplanes ianthinogenes]GGR41162.1 hypothetical protein GCM10010168_69890 [Actinoplanes ianthinogenes]